MPKNETISVYGKRKSATHGLSGAIMRKVVMNGSVATRLHVRKPRLLSNSKKMGHEQLMTVAYPSLWAVFSTVSFFIVFLGYWFPR